MAEKQVELAQTVILLATRLEEIRRELGGPLDRLAVALPFLSKVLDGLIVPDIMNVDQAGSYLGFAPKTISKLADSGDIPAAKVEGDWRFSKAALNSWITEASWRNLEKK